MAFPASSPAALDLVPPEHLEPPPGDELRYLVREDCALLLDTGRPVERDDTLDEEPRVQVRLRCPRRVRERWHAVTVLARVVAGEELAPWQVADAVAAEGFSARDLEPEDAMVGLPGPECDPPPLVSAPMAAETRAPTASPSAPGTTCEGSTRGACGRGVRRPTT